MNTNDTPIPSSIPSAEAIDPVEALRCEDLLGLRTGDPIARYGYFQNLTFVERSNGHVTMRDKHGNEKRVYEELFLKYAKLPNSAYQPRRGEPL